MGVKENKAKCLICNEVFYGEHVCPAMQGPIERFDKKLKLVKDEATHLLVMAKDDSWPVDYRLRLALDSAKRATVALEASELMRKAERGNCNHWLDCARHYCKVLEGQALHLLDKEG